MSAAAGIKLRSVVLWIAAALFGAGVLSAHVYKQNLYVRLSREAQKLEQEKRTRQNDLASIELDVKGLMRRQRLEELAVKRFGLAYAGAPERVFNRGEGASPAKTLGDAVAMASLPADSKQASNWVEGTVKWLTTGL
jgi:hypothetical protein